MSIREKLVELLKNQVGYTLPIFIATQTIEIMADALIANNVTVQEWIPVSERLPETTCRNFVMTSHGITVIAYFDGNVWRYGETLFVVDVTHWMPLPQPPKGEIYETE